MASAYCLTTDNAPLTTIQLWNQKRTTSTPKRFT